MPSRRPHTNSHHGCQRCKSKRVKCDQTQPKCLRCQRHNADCIYRHLLTAYDPFQQDGHASYPPARRLVPLQPRTRIRQNFQIVPAPVPMPPVFGMPPNLDWEERFLLHHYVSNLSGTSNSPVLESGISALLNEAIVRNASSHPFVQHAVLSYSALHLSAVSARSPGANHLVTALRHKDAAIAKFRPLLSAGIDSQKCEAAISASTVLVACTFALPIADHADTTGVDRIELLAQTIGLFQGIVALLRLGAGATATLEALRSCNVRKAVGTSYRLEVAWPEATTSLERVIRIIQSLDDSHETSCKRKGILSNAAMRLRNLIQRVAEDESSYIAVCMWLGRVDAEFVDMVRQRDPLALIILAHWAVCRRGTDVWWAREWPPNAVSAIVKALEGQYADLMGWCMAEANLEPSGHVIVEIDQPPSLVG